MWIKKELKIAGQIKENRGIVNTGGGKGKFRNISPVSSISGLAVKEECFFNF